jgi:hypothetical protein
MKVISSFAFVPLLFVLSVQSFAAGRTKEITLDKKTKVGKVELQPGTYKVAWSGTGPNVEVDFSKDRKVVASAAAKLANVRSEFDSAAQTRNVASGSAVLEELDFKNTQLTFSETDQSSGN